MNNTDKITLFEHASVPSAVMKLAVLSVISLLVMVIYNLADTYFVGIINSPVQNASVTLAAPLLLAFNAVNNLEFSAHKALTAYSERKIVMEIPALYILNKLFPLYGLAYAQLAAEIILATAAIIVLRRLFRRLSADNS